MIRTKNLQLLPCELPYFAALLQDKQELERLLTITIPDRWTEFPAAIPYAYDLLKANPALINWGMYLFIHAIERIMVGLGGFKGQPDANGKVEIGYEIFPDYRQRGFATEAAQGLIEYAFSDSAIGIIEADTLAESNASTRVLEKLGMQHVETIHDPEEGDLWHWRLNRN